ncbi:hypothetical protein SAMN05443667_101240 [Flavobacterium gillisiae]|uniref:Peptidoglycan binding domain-containing protein n=1 Tax=Flavobacterium gillisiae TaxID=150146 RepID=A0A1H3WTU5_9FLAO|nr:hypothetical protein [Flavobacterium gillisiae]SDZ90566.1 hypothetical protein SAMN05443667_101240 [Flavobacterium gillisiae]
MKPTKPQNTSLYVGLALLVGVGAYATTRNKEPEVVNDLPPGPGTNNTSSVPPKTAINFDKTLSVGSRGLEVEKLQTLMGITADGVFGPQTEAKLFSLKGVKQISVNQFSKTPNVVRITMIPVGSRVMSNTTVGAKIFGAFKKIDGSLYSSGVLRKTVRYGQNVGIIKSVLTANGFYVVYYTNDGDPITKIGFVRASEIEKY